MTCLADGRERCQEVAVLLRKDPRVAGVDVLSPQQGQRARWSIEVVVRGAAVPPAIAHAMTERGLGLADVSPQGPDHYVVVGVD